MEDNNQNVSIDEDEILNIIEGEPEEIEEVITLNQPLSYQKQKDYENIHWYYKYRIEVLQRLMKAHIIKNKNDTKLSILDIGIGTGTISTILENYGDCIHIEYDKNVINLNKNLNNVVFGKAPWELNINNNLKFDYIILFNILEYVDNVNWMIDILNTYLNDNGKILISTLMNPEKKGKNEELYNIKNRFKFEELNEIFYRNGLIIKDYTYFENLPKDKQIIESFNKFVEDEVLYFNIIPKDNNKIYSYLKEKEFPKIGINQLKNGQQIFIKLTKMSKKEKQKLIDELQEKNNKPKLIDKIIDSIAPRNK